ncbi:MAG TPA: NYN domain-containing protein [Candidatus Dormibacteraeota bacterium]|nr:NYN domain-containing protein [Candidatus Dormibacteraeota bacterium]
MDRFAIFVDVGYLVASVAELLTASPERSGVVCEYASLVSDLVQEARQDCGLPVLRTYWYDASLTGLPEHDQQTVANLPGVRLRLGRLVRGGQKGVDSRIVRDLIVLAHDRAMASAYVLAGDEDIREGMEEAQDHGVRVVLWGVPGINQSRVLCQQADEHRILPDEFWLRHFRLVDRPGEPSPDGRVGETPGRRSMVARPHDPGMRAAFQAATRSRDGEVVATWLAEVDAFERAAREAGAEFARVLLAEATPVEVERLARLTGWQVPRDLDGRLLRFAEERLGFLWERPELKATVRSGFWEEFRKTARGS